MMVNRQWIMWVIFFLALCLQVLPMPGFTLWLRPDWVLLVLIFWLLYFPGRIGVGCAFFLGLLLDLLNGTLLGEHALVLVIIAYMVIKLHQQIKMFPWLQQAFFILLVSLFYKLIVFAIQGVSGQLPTNILYWLAALVNAILWPWLNILLQRLSME